MHFCVMLGESLATSDVNIHVHIWHYTILRPSAALQVNCLARYVCVDTYCVGIISNMCLSLPLGAT